ERVTQSITAKPLARSTAKTFARVAELLAPTDPDRAERVAHSITSGWDTDQFKISALARVARALAVTAPDRSARLIADVERIAESTTHEGLRVGALTDIAQAL